MHTPQENKTVEETERLANPPRIGITMGDAAGIGPEIVLKALSQSKPGLEWRPVIIGDARFLSRTANELGLNIAFEAVRSTSEIPLVTDKIYVYDVPNLNEEFVVGDDSPIAGRAAGEYIEIAAGLCFKGDLEAIATAPISKKALSYGGYDFPGHTEMLASLTETDDFAMSFFAGDLRVVLLSTHVSLLDAIKLVKREAMTEIIRFTNRTLAKLLTREVTIAVAGLNPHASEGGMFGNEEEREITPAINECRDRYSIDVSGPYSPDTIFLRAFRGEFDAVVSCYHDQATIAVKCLSFGESVNVTLGLPIIRTSVDHGTAFNIAGKNIADCSSMKAAINLAAKLSLSS